jgi:nucleotide-binding universal stress UspA family protein
MTTPADHRMRNRGYVVPDTILLATDIGDADYLIPYAIVQARATNAELILAHVIAPVESLPLSPIAIPSGETLATEQEAKRMLEGMAAKVRGSGVACEIMVREGSPQHVVPEMVKSGHADRLILGTRGRGRLAKLLLGSVAEEILDKVEVPVCTIGPHAHTTSPPEAPRKILHPVSFRPGYEESACFALDIAQFYGSEITLLHVLEPNPQEQQDSDRLAKWACSELQRLIPDEAPLWTYVNAQVEVGKVVEQVLDVAAEMSADLVVLGIDKHGSFWPIRGERSAHDIIAQAKCPVLTIRHTVSAE